MGRVLAKQPVPDPPRTPPVCFGICPTRKEVPRWRNRPSLSPLENCQLFKEQSLVPPGLLGLGQLLKLPCWNEGCDGLEGKMSPAALETPSRNWQLRLGSETGIPQKKSPPGKPRCAFKSRNILIQLQMCLTTVTL